MKYSEYRELAKGKKCPACNITLPDIVYVYNHFDGWEVEEFASKQWLYKTCVNCHAEWALWKLGVPREMAKTNVKPVPESLKIVRTWKLPSRKLGKFYNIDLRVDGVWICDCPDFLMGAHQKGRSLENRIPCRHILQKKLELVEQGQLTSVEVSVSKETSHPIMAQRKVRFND